MRFFIFFEENMGDKKQLQYAIMKFLDDEAKNLVDDQKESLEGEIENLLIWNGQEGKKSVARSYLKEKLRVTCVQSEFSLFSCRAVPRDSF